MKKKVKLIIVISAVLVIALCIAGITAYLMDGDRVDNHTTIGGNTVQLVEEFIPPQELTPGVSFTKDIKVKNTGLNDCYVRILAVFSNADMEQYCDIDWNTTDWDYDPISGYYYYKGILPVNELTPSLFSTVTVKEDAPEAAIRDFDIIVYVESYQADGFSDYHAAWDNYQKNRPDVELPADDFYDIYVNEAADGSYTLKADHSFSWEGMTIHVTAVPDASHVVDGVEVTDSAGNSIPVTSGDGNQYSFDMPASDVTISCTVHQN